MGNTEHNWCQTQNVRDVQRFLYKIRRGERDPGSHPRAKFHHRVFTNVGWSPPKSSKYGNVGINLSLKGHPLKRFLKQNLALGGSPWSATSCHFAKYHPCGFKNVNLQPQIAKIANFSYKCAPKAVHRLNQFLTQNLARGGSPESASSRKMSPLWL